MADTWQVSGRLSYAGIPYSRLQQGTDTAPNPNDLRVNVHLATTELELAAPWGTELSFQLPAGRLSTSTVDESRTDTNVGDAEIRVRQNLPWVKIPQLELGLGLALPTGPYVERAGAANLPPEASFLTLGRGVTWGIAELQASIPITDRFSSYAQFSARMPFGRTKDEFQWGSEARGVVGGQARLPYGFAALAIAELQWRDGASEPDPFTDMRVETVNAGGTWWTVTPAVSYAISSDISVLGGLRIPVHTDVAGNQLVPSLGGFLALSASWSKPKRKTLDSATASVPAPSTPKAKLGKITVIDYWATWCAPCKKIDASLKAAEHAWSDVEVVRVNASGWPDNGLKLPDGAKGLPVVEVYDASGKRVKLLLGEDALNVVQVVEELRAK